MQVSVIANGDSQTAAMAIIAFHFEVIHGEYGALYTLGR